MAKKRDNSFLNSVLTRCGKDWVMEAEEDVGSCLDDLAEVERPPEKVAEMTAELADVKVS